MKYFIYYLILCIGLITSTRLHPSTFIGFLLHFMCAFPAFTAMYGGISKLDL